MAKILYVFERVGEYQAGAAGIISETPEQAAQLLRAYEVRRCDGHDTYARVVLDRAEIDRENEAHRHWPLYLARRAEYQARCPGHTYDFDWEPDHWLLCHTLALAEDRPAGVLFHDFHDG